MKMKLRSRYCGMCNLKNCYLSESDQVYIYKTTVRPVAEFAVPLFNSLRIGRMSEDFEKFQRRILKTIFGYDRSYGELLEKENIEQLSPRGEDLCKKNAKKAYQNKKYSDRWFPQRRACNYNMRRLEKFHIPKSLTNRMKNSPIFSMRRHLNSKL